MTRCPGSGMKALSSSGLAQQLEGDAYECPVCSQSVDPEYSHPGARAVTPTHEMAVSVIPEERQV